jgi:tRNA (adenine22-N1)-methyltransferase
MATLSKRLQVALSFLTGVRGFADIGCDHGYLPIEAIKQNIVEYAIASDNKKGPYLKAKFNVDSAMLSHKIEVRLAEGLTDLPAYIDAISILGMGGELIVKILEKADLSRFKTLVLGPNSEAKQVRYFLQDNGYMIDNESFIKDHGHYYQTIRAVPGKMILNPQEAAFGPLNIIRNNPVLKEFVIREINRLTSGFASATEESKIIIQSKINELREVIQ